MRRSVRRTRRGYDRTAFLDLKYGDLDEVAGSFLPLYIPALVLLLILVVAALLLPRLEVTQPPRPWHWFLELLVPGTSPGWRYFGSVPLFACTFLFLQPSLELSDWSFLFQLVPSVGRAYGVPTRGLDDIELAAAYIATIQPSWWSTLYLLPVSFFVLNAYIVWRSNRSRANRVGIAD